VRHIFIKQFTVPACIRCNNILGDAPIFDVGTRRRLVQTHLLKRKNSETRQKATRIGFGGLSARDKRSLAVESGAFKGDNPDKLSLSVNEVDRVKRTPAREDD
jgi:hypothetical protein